MQRIKAFADKKYEETSTSLNKSLEKKNAIYAEGDIDYFQKWVKGLESERTGDYQAAIKFYQEASKVSRYEMLSYDVALPLGRAYCLNNQKQYAVKALKYFIESANAELTGEAHQEWELSEEGKMKLKKDVEFAKWLAIFCEKK